MAWRVAACLPIIRGQVNERFPDRDKGSDGTIGDTAHAATKSDHNPDQFGVVRAQDFDDDTRDPAAPSLGKWLGERLRLNRDPRISYFISYGRIFYGPATAARNGVQPWTWLTYYGSDPHDTHCHLSVISAAASDDTRPWDLTLPGDQQQEDTLSAAEVAEIKAFITERSQEDREWIERHLQAKLGGTINRVVAILSAVTRGGQTTEATLAQLPALIAAEVNDRPAGEPIDIDELADTVIAKLGQNLLDGGA